jgi:hypothetical protein
VAGDGARQPEGGAEEVDRAGLAIVPREDARSGALVGRKRPVDVRDRARELWPAVLVGEVLRKDAELVTLVDPDARVESGRAGVAGELLLGEERFRERRGRDADEEHRDGHHRRERPPACERDAARREEHGVEGREVVRLATARDHERQGREVGPCEPAMAPAVATPERHETGEPHDGRRWIEHEDLLEDERQRRLVEHLQASGIGEELERRPPRHRLPGEVREDEDTGDGRRDPGAARREEPARRRQQEPDHEPGDQEHDAVPVEEADAEHHPEQRPVARRRSVEQPQDQ